MKAADVTCMLPTFGAIAPSRADADALSDGGNQTQARREGALHSNTLVREPNVCPASSNQKNSGPVRLNGKVFAYIVQEMDSKKCIYLAAIY